MSLEKTVPVTCPQCNREQPVVVWSSLNVQVSPEAKADFFNGNINVFECESCGCKAHLAVPFMYHDMGLGFCVQYYPPESMNDEEILSFYSPDGVSKANPFGPLKPPQELVEKTSYMLHPHIVFSMQEALNYVLFREKLAAFHAQQQEPRE